MGPSGPMVSEWSSLATGIPASVVVGLGCNAVMRMSPRKVRYGTAVVREVLWQGLTTSRVSDDLDVSGAEVGWCSSAPGRRNGRGVRSDRTPGRSTIGG